MSNLEFVNSSEEQPIMDTRIIGDRVMKVTVVPPVDPERVKVKDRVYPDYIGSKPMITVAAGFTEGSFGRKAPTNPRTRDY